METMSYHFFVNKRESNVSGWSLWWEVDSIFIIFMLNVSNAECMRAWIFCGVLRLRSNYYFLLLLFFSPFKNGLYCKTTKLCIYWSRRCSLVQIDQKKFLQLSVIFFSTWLLYGCVLMSTALMKLTYNYDI